MCTKILVSLGVLCVFISKPWITDAASVIKTAVDNFRSTITNDDTAVQLVTDVGNSIQQLHNETFKNALAKVFLAAVQNLTISPTDNDYIQKLQNIESIANDSDSTDSITFIQNLINSNRINGNLKNKLRQANASISALNEEHARNSLLDSLKIDIQLAEMEHDLNSLSAKFESVCEKAETIKQIVELELLDLEVVDTNSD